MLSCLLALHFVVYCYVSEVFFFSTRWLTIEFWSVYKTRMFFWRDFQDLKGRLIHRNLHLPIGTKNILLQVYLICFTWSWLSFILFPYLQIPDFLPPDLTAKNAKTTKATKASKAAKITKDKAEQKEKPKGKVLSW